MVLYGAKGGIILFFGLGFKDTKTVAELRKNQNLTAKAQTLADCSADFEINTVIPALVANYVAAIQAETTVANKNEAKELQAIISTVNDPTAAVTDLDAKATSATTTADELLVSLKQVTLTLSNVMDANKAQYFADKVQLATAADTTKSVDSLPAIQKVVNASNAVVAFNAATSATLVKDAISAFAVATANTDYINLSSTGKLEVAALVFNEKMTSGTLFATTGALKTAITSQITARGALCFG